MLTTTPDGWWLPSPNSATRIASPNSVSSLISIANPGVAGVLVCFVVRAICLSPGTTIHHSKTDNDQGNCGAQTTIKPIERRSRCGVIGGLCASAQAGNSQRYLRRQHATMRSRRFGVNLESSVFEMRRARSLSEIDLAQRRINDLQAILG